MLRIGFIVRIGQMKEILKSLVNAATQIITDIIMPEKDGIEVIVEVLKDNPELPIIAISGGRRAVTADFNLDSAEMLGVKGILQKPFTHEQLQELIESVLVV